MCRPSRCRRVFFSSAVELWTFFKEVLSGGFKLKRVPILNKAKPRYEVLQKSLFIVHHNNHDH